MVAEGLLNIVFLCLRGLLALLPDVSWSTGSVSSFMDYVSMACYLFPMNTIVTIMGLVITLMVFRIVVSIIKTIWDVLPFM